MITHLYYPDGVAEDRHYPADIAAVGMRFPELLFSPDRLGEVVHPSFEEHLPGRRGVSLKGLAALQEYRRTLGTPVLDRVNMFAVPPSMPAPWLGPDSKDCAFNTFFELIFRIRAEDLPPEVRRQLPSDAEVPVVLLMWEPLKIRAVDDGDELPEGVKPGQLMVFGRSYKPVLEHALGNSPSQHGYVRRQIGYYVEFRRAYRESSRYAPAWQRYGTLLRDRFTFATDPTIGDGWRP